MSVSRETLDQFLHLERLVQKWNKTINLVGRSTMAEFHDRHVADGIALVKCANDPQTWVDLGSGGGFPGLIVAALIGKDCNVTMVESDARKCTFLATAKRELGLRCHILHGRIEEIAPQSADVVSARALARLDRLLDFGFRHGSDKCHYLFPKGRTWPEEEVEARRDWDYTLNVIEGNATPGAVILDIKNLRRLK